MRTTSFVLVSLLAACGGGSDPCATSVCGEQSRTTIKWTFDRYPERGFQMDSCTDLGVSKVAVDMVDGAGGVQSLQTDCGNGQLAFFGFAEGDYTVYVTPLVYEIQFERLPATQQIWESWCDSQLWIEANQQGTLQPRPEAP